MFNHCDIDNQKFSALFKAGRIVLGGNRKQKIYGYLRCASGKRMIRSNRVFFTSEQEALDMGYRPCGNCMKSEYKKWISSVK